MQTNETTDPDENAFIRVVVAKRSPFPTGKGGRERIGEGLRGGRTDGREAI